jgi:hypothetical protein
MFHGDSGDDYRSWNVIPCKSQKSSGKCRTYIQKFKKILSGEES